MFVSHQWLSHDHPDPHGEQFRVLQDALRNLRSGKSQAGSFYLFVEIRNRICSVSVGKILLHMRVPCWLQMAGSLIC